MKFIIYTPNFTNHCGGIYALHNLAWDLQCKGHEVLIAWATVGNPEKPVTFLKANPSIDSIAIYPEIIPDNPLGLQKIVRWILSPIGDDWKELRKNDLIMSWWYWDSNPVLYVPYIETRHFYSTNNNTRTLK